ncbi:MAG: sugar kinase [Smithella sp.]
MKRMTENKIILIVAKTRLEELTVRFNTISQAKFYIEHLGADFSDYENEHHTYQLARRETERQLNALGRLQVLGRDFLPNFIFGKEETVVVLGRDGLVANSLKYLDAQPVVGINPDPERWEGTLLPFNVKDTASIIVDLFEKRRSCREITMAQVTLNNGQKLYGVNDLFIGPKTHTSLRYQIKLGEKEEHQSSSGIIVSTGLGSTGWLRSILAGANGICASLGKPLDVKKINNFNWDSDYLLFTVREPWPSKILQGNLVFGKITGDNPLKLISQMPERGVIFSDGIEHDFLEFNSGAQATVSVAGKKGRLVV